MSSQSGRHHSRRVTSRLLALVLATVALLVGPVGLGSLGLLPHSAPQAAAAEPDQPAEITIDSMSPSVIIDRSDLDQEITITGEVKNVGTKALGTPQVFFWRSFDPITTDQGLQQAFSSEATNPEGSRVQFDTAVNLFENLDSVLKPGAARSFSITVTLGQLGLPSVDGVYLVGVQARADRLTTTGRARLFLPVSDLGSEVTQHNTVKMASLVLLRSQPALLQSGVAAVDDQPASEPVFADDHLAAEVAAGGRLTQLLADAGRQQVSVAIDPDLVVELEQMVDGYLVRSGDGTLTDGAGASDASLWLRQLDTVLDRQDSYRLPYASTDIAALAHAGMTQVLSRGEAAAAVVGRTKDLPLLALPTDGLADQATVAAAAALKPTAILLSDSVTAQRGPLFMGPDGVPIVTFTASSAIGGPAPEPNGTATHLRQAFLATSWVDQANAALGTSLGSIRLITDPDDTGAAEVAQAPWIAKTTVADLLSGTPGTAPSNYDYPTEAPAAELTARQLAAVANLGALETRYSALVQSAGQTTDAAAATARAASAGWRSQARLSRPWVATQADRLTHDLDDGVRITGGREPRLTTRNSVFPLTLTNTLNVPVQVKLSFRTPNSQRLAIAPVPPSTETDTITLRPGESQQITNQAVARTNGNLPVTAQLSTVEGQPIGASFSMVVHAANVGLVGWVIVIASGLTLIGATAFRIRQVARERHRVAAAAGRSPEPAEHATV